MHIELELYPWPLDDCWHASWMGYIAGQHVAGNTITICYMPLIEAQLEALSDDAFSGVEWGDWRAQPMGSYTITGERR